jgi:hypothetical protein
MIQKKNRWMAPGLVVSLLLVIGAESQYRPKPADAEPFHARVFQLRQEIPSVMGDWVGEDQPLPAAAIEMLRPNAELCRVYKNKVNGRRAVLLFVQCRDARDMGAHYPPVCYRGQGYICTSGREDFDCEVKPGQIVKGSEYLFTMPSSFEAKSQWVIDLLIVPNREGTFARDIDEVRRAAADYLRQYYGAAQIQLVMDGSYSKDIRYAIFRELMADNMPLINILRSGGTQ